MPYHEHRPGPSESGPRYPILLPAGLTDSLRDLHLAALLHGSDSGTLVVVKAPSPEPSPLRTPVPIDPIHELDDHPRSSVVRNPLTFFDHPRAPLCLKTFTNVIPPAQHAHFSALTNQEEIALLFYDELLRHRLSKRPRNSTAQQIPRLPTTAEHLRAAIPPDRRDFDRATAEVMGVRSL
jgi:hypothetical protein